jgi:hypothetical protein
MSWIQPVYFLKGPIRKTNSKPISMAAQLNLMLGQKVGSAPDWVTKANSRAGR